VKNQAQCGSCWAFSTTGGLEGAIFTKFGTLESLSEEELVQCDKVDAGCQGGSMESGFAFIKKSHGIASEKQYPYTKATGGGKTGNCVKAKETPVAKYTSAVTGVTKVKAKDEAALKAAVALHPVSVAVEADKQAFQFYKKGIIKAGPKCGYKLDHGVLAVGYGTDSGTMYWKVKNSWGPTWGDHGYLRVERTESTNSKGTCGIAMDASYPILGASPPPANSLEAAKQQLKEAEASAAMDEAQFRQAQARTAQVFRTEQQLAREMQLERD
jgi:C1A family cysteine protease